MRVHPLIRCTLLGLAPAALAWLSCAAPLLGQAAAPIPVEIPRAAGFGSPFDPSATGNGPPPPLTPVPVERSDAVGAKASTVGWDEFGRTPDGRPLEKAHFGVGSRLVLIVGPLGGDEDGALATTERLAAWFQEFPERLNDLRVTIVRTPNPDGFARGTRANARGVDLNRNFPTTGWRKIPHGNNWASGSQPASESETEALIELIREQRPNVLWIVNSHSGPADSAANEAAKLVGAVVSRHCGSNLRELSSAASGSLARYADEAGVPTIVSTWQDNGTPDDCWNRFGSAVLAGLTAVSLEPTLAGPSSPPAGPLSNDPVVPAIGNASAVRNVGVNDMGGSPGLTPLRRPGETSAPVAPVPLNNAAAGMVNEPPPAYPASDAMAPATIPSTIEPTSPFAATPPAYGELTPVEPPTLSGPADGLVVPHPALNFFQRRTRSSLPPTPPAAPVSGDDSADGREFTESAPQGTTRPGTTPRRSSPWPSGYRPPQPPIPLYDPQAKGAAEPTNAEQAAPSRGVRVVPASNET